MQLQSLKNGLTVRTVSDTVINAAAATTIIVSEDETEKQTPQEDAHDVTDTEAETPEQVTQPFNLKGYKLADALQVTVLSVTSSQIRANTAGVWLYDLQNQITSLKHHIASLTQDRAITYLSHLQGVEHAGIHLNRFDF